MGIGEIKIITRVNKRDEVIGSSADNEMIKNKEAITRAANIIIFNDKGEIFLQKRSKHKYRFPLHWDSSVGGKVDKDKTYLATAIAEAKEELGITVHPKQLEFVKKKLITTDIKEFTTIYKLVCNGPFTLSSWEVVDGRFFSLKEIQEMLKKGEKFSPCLIQILLELKLQV